MGIDRVLKRVRISYRLSSTSFLILRKLRTKVWDDDCLTALPVNAGVIPLLKFTNVCFLKNSAGNACWHCMQAVFHNFGRNVLREQKTDASYTLLDIPAGF